MQYFQDKENNITNVRLFYWNAVIYLSVHNIGWALHKVKRWTLNILSDRTDLNLGLLIVLCMNYLSFYTCFYYVSLRIKCTVTRTCACTQLKVRLFIVLWLLTLLQSFSITSALEKHVLFYDWLHQLNEIKSLWHKSWNSQGHYLKAICIFPILTVPKRS